MDILTLFENYLNGLCSQHKEVLHAVGDKRAFHRYANDEAADLSTNAASPYVRLSTFTGVGKQESMWVFAATVEFLYNIKQSGPTAQEINIARRKAFQLVEDFDARIRNDYEEGDRCSFIEALYEPTIEPIGMVDNSAYGWEMTIRFGKSRAEFDDQKWNI